jgi:hypothetical protein
VARWKNFQVWHGRWPHWRADGVVYFASFRHRRPLDDAERATVFASLMRGEGRHWELAALGVAPERTSLLVKMVSGREGVEPDLGKVLERAKKKAGDKILSKTGERFSPFGTESFDRIVRDEEEMEAFLAEIAASTGSDTGDCEFLYLPGDRP